jgi:putative transposase
MKRVLDSLCDYRRYCWNQGLELWNDMYVAHVLNKDNPLPNHHDILKIMVANKQDWQYSKSSRVLQQSIKDLSEAWKHFFRKDQSDWGKPHFKSRKLTKQGFKSDRIKFIKGKLRLDKPHQVKDLWYDIKIRGELLPYNYGTVSIARVNNTYYASIPYKIDEVTDKPKTHKKTAVDVNVGHMNYTDGVINVLPKKLSLYYNRIKHYQRMLARKQPKSKNYHAVRTKLQRDYSKVTNLQHDIIQKFTTSLVDHYDKIVIEDLDVKHMKMGIASKGLQRAQFGYFRQVLTYKCAWYNKELILADRFYPSTQRCSVCGNIKTGDDRITLQGNQKHHTKHNEYICYNCGSILDRDDNAVNNLLALVN